MVVTICGLKQNGCYNLWLQTELLLQSVASHTQLARLWKTPELTSMFHCVCSGKWHRRPWPCNSINVGPPCHLHPPQLISLPSPGSSTTDVCSRRHVFQQVLVWASADSGGAVVQSFSCPQAPRLICTPLPSPNKVFWCFPLRNSQLRFVSIKPALTPAFTARC